MGVDTRRALHRLETQTSARRLAAGRGLVCGDARRAAAALCVRRIGGWRAWSPNLRSGGRCQRGAHARRAECGAGPRPDSPSSPSRTDADFLHHLRERGGGPYDAVCRGPCRYRAASGNRAAGDRSLGGGSSATPNVCRDSASKERGCAAHADGAVASRIDPGHSWTAAGVVDLS